jgi:hypothetical protein
MRVPTENQITGLSKLVQFDFGGQASQGEGRPHDVPSHHNTGPRVSSFFLMLRSESSQRDRYTCTIQEIPCFRGVPALFTRQHSPPFLPDDMALATHAAAKHVYPPPPPGLQHGRIIRRLRKARERSFSIL